jgi:hypothetical protein
MQKIHCHICYSLNTDEDFICDKCREYYCEDCSYTFTIQLNEYKTKDNYVFMFGKPSDDKIRMYEYFIKICFPDYKLVIDYTSGFPNINIGYYLIK